MDLTANEIIIILEALEKMHGPGYATGIVGKLQAKLSIWLQVKSNSEMTELLRSNPE